MANITPSLSTVSFPVFAPSQILTSGDLNGMVDYLDDQNRFTRLFTIGIGILPGGLMQSCEVVDGQTIVSVTPGIGISSDGHLFFLENPDVKSSSCLFNYMRPRVISEYAFKCGKEKGSCSDSRNPLDVYELEYFDADNSEIDSDYVLIDELLTTANIPIETFKNYVLVFLRCREDITRVPCFNECDEGGTDAFINIRKILLPKAVVESLIGEDGTKGDETHQDSLGIPPFIRRLDLSGKELCSRHEGVTNLLQFKTRFCDTFDEAIAEIARAYQQAAHNLSELGGAETTAFDGLGTKLTAVKDIYCSTLKSSTVQGVQYFYDYLKDLVSAYQEFESAWCEIEISSSFLPNPCKHPGFIVLGPLNANQNVNDSIPRASATSNAIIDNSCRTHFLASQISDSNVEKLIGKATFFFDRMMKLCESNRLEKIIDEIQTPSLSNTLKSSKIRITASKGKNLPLSQRAIPYYYSVDDALRECWNYELFNKKYYDNRTKKLIPASSAIPSYRNKYNNALPFVPPFGQLLHYDMDTFEFFRVEGHIGRKVGDVSTQLKSLRRELNLPFDIKFVKLGSVANSIPIEGLPQKPYLELIYKNVRCDLLAYNEDDNTANLNFPTSMSTIYSIEEFCKFWANLSDAEKEALYKYEVKSVACQFVLLNEICEQWENCKTEPECLFCEFVMEHRGLEHQAGVEKGGTLVLVYLDAGNNRPRSTVTREKADASNAILDALKVKGVTQKMLKEVEIVLTKADRIDATNNIISNMIVVADFALPYYCCDGEGRTASPPDLVEIEPSIFIGHKDFCITDDHKYPILTHPQGGMLNIDNVSPDEPCFKPSDYALEEPDSEREIVLEYSGNGNTVTQTITVWPKANARFSAEPSVTSSGINFIGEGLDRSTYHWEIFLLSPKLMNDKEMIWEPVLSSEGFTKEFTAAFEEGKYRIQMTASNPACKDFYYIELEAIAASAGTPGTAAITGNDGDADDVEDEVILNVESSGSQNRHSSSKAKTPKEIKGSDSAKIKEKKTKSATDKTKTTVAKKIDEKLTKLIRQRSSSQKNVLKLMKTGNLKKEFVDKEVRPFFQIPQSDVEEMESHFESAKDAILMEMKAKTKAKAVQKKYFELLSAMTNYYLDAAVIKSPSKVRTIAKYLLQNLVKQLKALKLDTDLIIQTWNATELKELINTRVVDAYTKILK